MGCLFAACFFCMGVHILVETKHYLVICKPAGMLVHTDGISKEQTVVDWLSTNKPEIVGVGEPLQLKTGEIIKRPGIVHRLDRDTSGILVVTKTQDMFECLKKQFQDHTIVKEYRAFV